MIFGNTNKPNFFSLFSIIKLLYKFLMGLSVIFWRLQHFLTKFLISKLHIFCKPAGTTRKTCTFRDLFKTFYGKSVLSAMHNLSFLTWKNSIIFSFLKQKNKENFSSIHCNKIFGNVRSKEIQIVLRLFLVIATYVLSSQFKPVQSTIQPPTLL